MVDEQVRNLADGRHIDGTSGVLTWTPQAGQEGMNPVALIVKNGAGSDALSGRASVMCVAKC